MGDSFERFALILDIFRQVAVRVKAGPGRRSEPLTRVDACLIHGFEGEARCTLLVVQLGEYRGGTVIQRAVWQLFVLVRAPKSKFSACVSEGMEPANIQAFVAQGPLKLSM